MPRLSTLCLLLGLPLILAACPGDSKEAAAPDAASATSTKKAPPAPPKARALGGRWEEAGALPMGIERPTAVRLTDGRVFAYGNGEDPRGAIWDPKTNRWTATKPSKRPRGEAVASVLPDGTLLVTGGVHIPKNHYVLRIAASRSAPANCTHAGSKRTSTATPLQRA